ncbi:uncharacterized protein [Hyperolius riggenbachi]|uniref:uncharacterized protein isoform X2 n=1 Tax=Hyperolius riggenbachi TaxID=752182 RepID=UPI0035A27E37
MQQQEWWNDPKIRQKKDNLFWIGSRNAQRADPTPDKLSPVSAKPRERLHNINHIQAVQDDKYHLSSIRKSREVFKRENHLQLAVEGATCSLQERPKTQEGVSSKIRPSFRCKIDLTIGNTKATEFRPHYLHDVQQLSTGRRSSIGNEPQQQVMEHAPYPLSPKPPPQKPDTTTLHLYLPSADPEEEEEPTRNTSEVPENIDASISKATVKVTPRKPAAQIPLRKLKEKWIRLPCKEALSTASLSVQFGPDSKGLLVSPGRRLLLDTNRNKFPLNDDTTQVSYLQRPASNIGCGMGSYYTDHVVGNSDYGLNVKTLTVHNDRSERGKLFRKNLNVRCRSQPNILDIKERGAYI